MAEMAQKERENPKKVRFLDFLASFWRKEPPSPLWCQKHWEIVLNMDKAGKLNGLSPISIKMAETGMMMGIEMFNRHLEESGEESRPFQLDKNRGLCCAFDEYTLRGILSRSRVQP